jgi:hypothetical protein
MKIHENMRIIELQSEFNKKLPFLKLEFYKTPHKSGEGSEQGLLLDPYTTIKEASSSDSSGELHFNPEMTVSNLENLLKEQFGLHAQVFRKSKGVWLQTTATDDWTLTRQNESGQRA